MHPSTGLLRLSEPYLYRHGPSGTERVRLPEGERICALSKQSDTEFCTATAYERGLYVLSEPFLL